jgi:hypothetical protein
MLLWFWDWCWLHFIFLLHFGYSSNKYEYDRSNDKELNDSVDKYTIGNYRCTRDFSCYEIAITSPREIKEHVREINVPEQ